MVHLLSLEDYILQLDENDVREELDQWWQPIDVEIDRLIKSLKSLKRNATPTSFDETSLADLLKNCTVRELNPEHKKLMSHTNRLKKWDADQHKKNFVDEYKKYLSGIHGQNSFTLKQLGTIDDGVKDFETKLLALIKVLYPKLKDVDNHDLADVDMARRNFVDAINNCNFKNIAERDTILETLKDHTSRLQLTPISNEQAQEIKRYLVYLQKLHKDHPQFGLKIFKEVHPKLLTLDELLNQIDTRQDDCTVAEKELLEEVESYGFGILYDDLLDLSEKRQKWSPEGEWANAIEEFMSYLRQLRSFGLLWLAKQELTPTEIDNNDEKQREHFRDAFLIDTESSHRPYRDFRTPFRCIALARKIVRIQQKRNIFIDCYSFVVRAAKNSINDYSLNNRTFPWSYDNPNHTGAPWECYVQHLLGNQAALDHLLEEIGRGLEEALRWNKGDMKNKLVAFLHSHKHKPDLENYLTGFKVDCYIQRYLNVMKNMIFPETFLPGRNCHALDMSDQNGEVKSIDPDFKYYFGVRFALNVVTHFPTTIKTLRDNIADLRKTISFTVPHRPSRRKL